MMDDGNVSILPYSGTGDDGSSVGTGYVVPTAQASVMSNFVPVLPSVLTDVTLVGAKAGDAVRAGDYFLATWEWRAAGWLPTGVLDIQGHAVHLRNSLPGLGFIPASLPSSTPGDRTITFLVRLNSGWGAGQNVATVMQKLDSVPWNTQAWSFVLKRLEAKPRASVSSSGIPTAVDAATDAQNQEAASSGLSGAVAAVGGTLRTSLFVVAGIVAVFIGVAAYRALRK
jgi:hypothetical protein